MAQTASWLGPIAIGAAAMYLLDPSTGRRRRALMRDQAVHLSRKTRDGADALARDLQNRAAGLAARVRHRGNGEADDAVVEARVRSALGRVCSHPGAIGVASVDGVVELVGPVLEAEYDGVWRTVRGVAGVVDVIDNLVVHADANSVPALQGEGSLPTNGSWSPTSRMLAVIGAAGLIAFGLRSRSLTGGIAAAAGAGLIARAFTDYDLTVFDQLQQMREAEQAPAGPGATMSSALDTHAPGAIGVF